VCSESDGFEPLDTLFSIVSARPTSIDNSEVLRHVVKQRGRRVDPFSPPDVQEAYREGRQLVCGKVLASGNSLVGGMEEGTDTT